jgi:hypothetical protein
LLFGVGKRTIVILIDGANYRWRNGDSWNKTHQALHVIRIDRKNCRLKIFIQAMRDDPHWDQQRHKSADREPFFHCGLAKLAP